jgi:tRNA A37 methylthiotransferase MiaB
VGLPGAVPPAVVASRRERLLALEAETMTAYHRRLIGRRLDVLVEGADPRRPGWARGTSCRYAPVAFPGHAPALLARRVPVIGAAVEGGIVLGHPEAETSERKLRPGRLTLPVIRSV